MSDLTRRLASRDAEFDDYRQQVLNAPESKLQAEITMLTMEKVSSIVIHDVYMQFTLGLFCTCVNPIVVTLQRLVVLL